MTTKPDSPRPPVMFDFATALRDLGGARGLYDALVALAFRPPAQQTVWMWRLRGRVPPHWVPTVLLALHRAGRAPANYLVPVEPELEAPSR